MKKKTEICIYDSSMIHSSNFNYDTKELKVEFRGGTTYVFNSVDHLDYVAFANSSSIGKAFNEFIRYRYDGTKIADEVQSNIKE